MITIPIKIFHTKCSGGLTDEKELFQTVFMAYYEIDIQFMRR